MASELRGFVFSITFIIVFAGLLAAVPLGLRGSDRAPTIVTPVDPSLVTGFSETEQYNLTDFFGASYGYTLGSENWICTATSSSFRLYRKVLLAGILWLGDLDAMEFVAEDGTDRGTILTTVEIEADATNGSIRYNLFSSRSGESFGGFVIYWEAASYDDADDAYDSSDMYLLHGIGLSDTATNNIGELLVLLLVLQLPDVPPLINLLLATPVWACIVYILWYVIKEMIPFV